jgi:hypothetical protein
MIIVNPLPKWVLQKWALVTKQKFASPLNFDPSYQAYWSENTRDTVFGASTNAFDTKHRLLLLPPELLRLSPAFTCGTCTSINKLHSRSYSNIPTPPLLAWLEQERVHDLDRRLP